MSVKIIIPGALSTVQDAGRFGYQNAGITTSGAMDQMSYKNANKLVGNEAGEAVIEAVLFGGTMEFTEDTVIAITGADMEPKVDDNPIDMNRAIFIRSGQTLTLGSVRRGCRTYIAFAGGIDVPVVMGSRSTNLKCMIGGFEGRALKAGDELKTGIPGRTYEEIKNRSVNGLVYSETILLRVIEGPQQDYFTEQGIQTFYSEEYTVSDKSDRMGYRMDGPQIESKNGTDIISDGIALGSVQIPADGKPIVLLADRQTTGGYAKIATVCSFDIPRLVQGKPGDKVRFKKITINEANEINEKVRE